MRVWAAFVAIVAVLAIGGCSGDAPPPTPAPAPANQINAQPREKLRDGGTLSWPLSSLPANFNYYQVDGAGKDTADVVQAVLPSAFLADARGTPYPNRDLLAADPEVATAPRQVVTYRINPRAVWSDGTPVTWADFHWQWVATSGANPAYRVASAKGYDQIASVERGSDDRAVVVTFTRAYADWTALFNPLYPASTNQDPTVFNDGWRPGPPLSAGPFRLDRVDVTTRTISVVRNERWWGAKARLESIAFRVVDPSVQLDALVDGTIDFVDVGLDPGRYVRAKAAGADIRVAGGPSFRQLTFNAAGPILSDVTVRRALAMGIDRAAIGRAVLGPLGISPGPLGNHLLMINQDGYRDNSGDVGRYDPDQARKLLDEAGWRLSGATRAKDGTPLALSFVVPDGVTPSGVEAALVKDQLAAVGVAVTVTAVPAGDFFDRYVTPGAFDLTTFSWIGTPYPVSASRSIYASTTGADGQNYARVGSSEIDALFDAAMAELTRAKAIELANQIDAKLWQEVHSITTYQRPHQIACRKGLANVGAFGFASPVYADIGWAA